MATPSRLRQSAAVALELHDERGQNIESGPSANGCTISVPACRHVSSIWGERGWVGGRQACSGTGVRMHSCDSIHFLSVKVQGMYQPRALPWEGRGHAQYW